MPLPRNSEYIYYIEEPSGQTIYTPITGDPDDQASPTETANASVDESTGRTIPSINWNADSVTPIGSGDSGTEGAAPSSYPNVPVDPIPVIRYKTIIRKSRSVVENFDPEALEDLHNQGITFIVIYTDGTEDEVDWTEVYDPKITSTELISFEADNIGAASNQHFWKDTNGVHVTDDEQDAWEAEYKKVGHGELSNPTDIKPWHNILMNSLGILLRRGLINLVSMSKSAIAFYDGSGNQNDNITAFFGRDNAQIGRSTEKHIILDSEGITAYNGDGTIAPLQAANISAAEANIQQLQADTADISTIRANSAKVKDLTANQLNAASGYIESLTSANVSANDISANKATITSLVSGDVTVTALRAASAYIESLKSSNITTDNISAASGYIESLKSSNVTAADISSNKATITSLVSGDVTVTALRAASAFISALTSSNITASNLVADHADISNLKATKVDVDDLEADYIKADVIESTYMKADISNSNVAWIQNGVIKDGSISNAMIASVSANKLTAGTIDASNITVTNLNADNITTGTINGQRIGEGSLSLSKLEDDVYTEAEVDAKLSTLQSEIDGAIETWTGTAVPTLSNTPASTWTTNADRDKHVGDVYFVVNSNSQQNGYNYRFTKSGSTYSWQLIKDNDVTNALARLTTAEGKIGTIEQFDSDISAWKTNTDEELTSIKSNHTALAGRVTTAEGTLATKVDTTTFNTLSQTVEGQSSSIQQLTTETTTLASKITFDAPYRQVEWVKSDGRQFVGTRYRADQDSGFDIDFQLYDGVHAGLNKSRGSINQNFVDADNVTYTGTLFGNYKKGTTQIFGLSTNGGSGRAGWICCDATNKTAANGSVGFYEDGRRQQASLRNRVYTAPDGTTKTLSATVDFIIPYYVYVFAAHETGTATTSAISMKLYSLKFYDGDTLAVDLIPAVRNSDDMPGLYDSIENHFYPCYGLETGPSTGDLLGTPLSLKEQTTQEELIITDTRTKNSRVLTGTCPSLTDIRDGQKFIFNTRYTYATETSEYPSREASSSDCIMDLEIADGKHPTWGLVYYNGSTIVTTQFAAGTSLRVTYRENVLFGTTAIRNGFFLDADYNTNTNDTARYVQWYNNIYAKKALRNASIIVGNDDGYEEIDEEVTFDLSYPILWRTANLAINKTDYSYSWTLTYDRNLATCYPEVSGVKNQILYLVGIPNGGLFTIKAPMLTFDTPNSANGLYYIPIGKLGNQSTGQNYFIFSTSINPTMMAYIGDSFQQVQSLVVKTTNKLNETIDTVDEHTRKIGILETTVETKADGSSLETVTNRLNTVSDTVDGHTQSISSINNTLSSKADGSTVSSLTTRVNTISDTVDGHTQSISSITSTQSTMQSTLNKTVVESTQLWFTGGTGSGIPQKPTTQITSNSTSYGDWRTVVPSYDEDHPEYYYCYQWKYSDGSYGWSDVVYDTAMSSVQSISRQAETTADNAKDIADKSIKDTIQLWYSKSNSTAPSAPNSKVTSTSTSSDGWRVVVPSYDSSKKYYFYCYQHELSDGTYKWSDVVYDNAMSQAIGMADGIATGLSTVSTRLNTVSDTVDGHTSDISRIDSTVATKADSSTVSTLQSDYASYKQTTDEFKSQVGTTYATKVELAKISQPNLIPSVNYFPTTTDIGYGWSHVDYSNTSSSTTSHYWRLSHCNAVKPGEIYTIMIEFQNWTCSVNPTGNYMYIQQIDGNQFWGSNGISSNGKEEVSPQYATYVHYEDVTDGSMCAYIVKEADVDHNPTADGYLLTYRMYEPANSTTSFDIRISLYEGEYHGLYKPYVDQSLTDRVTAVEERVTTAETSITQTNETIALKANTSDVYTKTQTDGLISTEVTNRNTAIEQSANAVKLFASQTYSTKADTSQMAQPNLSPYFSHPVDDIFSSTENPNGYWFSDLGNTYWSALTDGWGHVERDNSQGSSSVYCNYYVHRFPDNLKPSTKYTYLVEWKNFTTTDDSAWITVATDYNDTADAFVGGTLYTNIEGSVGHAYINATTVDSTSINASNIFSRGYLGIHANDATSGDFRISIYEGDYSGPYKPYVDQSLSYRVSSAEATLSVQAGQIESKVSADGIISSINQTPETVKIQANRVAIDGAAIFSNSDFRSAADAAYDAKGAASDVQDNLDNLSIGGRNLLKGTSSIPNSTRVFSRDISCSDAYGWYAYSTKMTITATENGIKFTHNATTNRDGIVLYLTEENACVGGEDLVLSCEYRTNVSGWYTPYILNTEAPNTRDDNSITAVVSTEEWERGVWKLNFPSTEDNTTLALLFGYISVANGWIEIKKNTLKLEKGNTATAWSPAPEDTLYHSDMSNVVVSVYPVSIDWNTEVATLGVRCLRNGQLVTPTGYSWTRDSLTTVLGTTATLEVTDLDAVYNCTVTFNV